MILMFRTVRCPFVITWTWLFEVLSGCTPFLLPKNSLYGRKRYPFPNFAYFLKDSVVSEPSINLQYQRGSGCDNRDCASMKKKDNNKRTQSVKWSNSNKKCSEDVYPSEDPPGARRSVWRRPGWRILVFFMQRTSWSGRDVCSLDIFIGRLETTVDVAVLL